MKNQTAVESTATSFQEQLIWNVLEGRANGWIDDATNDFADEFRFKDYGIGLEFHDKKSLAEFFEKTREFYPDSSIHIDAIFVSGDHVVGEWTLQTTLAEPFFGGLTRKVPISLQGASILRTENGKVTDWADYYDGLTSRRTALAAHFTEYRWVKEMLRRTDMTLVEMLHTQALRDPGATVLVCEEEKHSYGELDTRVPRANGRPWRRWLVVILAWVGIFAVVLLGLIFCSAVAVGLVVRHLQL